MVELLERVHEQLPVGGDARAVPEARRHPLERVALESGHHGTEEVAQRLLRLGRKVHEDEPGPHLAGHRDEAGPGGVEVEELALLLYEREPALQVVTPPVVLARELPAEPAALLA